jgi:tripartite-type tricarboxylate transporter receptor subunit TctC
MGFARAQPILRSTGIARRIAAALLGALALLLAAAPGRGAGYPDRPIHIIVPFEPGGGGDIIVRLVGQELSQRLGVAVVVENRTGASGNIGTDVVAHAAADGYTLLMANVAPMAINAALYRQLPYDPVKNFTAIAPLAVFANILVVPPSLGVHDVKALVALSKNRPAGLNYASAGAGSITNLAAVMFGLSTGANMVQVPFRGGGPAIAALVGAHVDLYFSSLPAALPYIQSGQLVALGVTSAARSASAPEIPTLAESGLPGFDAVTWIGLVGPAGLPDEVVARLNTAVNEILRTPAMQDRMLQVGAEPSFGSADGYAAYIRSELTRWAEIVRAAHIPPQ